MAYFGVGLDQTFDIKYDKPEYALVGKDDETLNNLSFAAEKIGIKFKPHYLRPL